MIALTCFDNLGGPCAASYYTIIFLFSISTTSTSSSTI